MDEATLRGWMKARRLTILEGSDEDRIAAVAAAMGRVLPRKRVSDRTGQRRVIEWLARQIEAGQRPRVELLRRVLDAVIEASGPTVRNRNAVFMHILTTELGYRRVGKTSEDGSPALEA
jgi:hypothetical protein